METLSSFGRGSSLIFKELSKSIIDDLNSGKVNWKELDEKAKEEVISFFAPKINYMVQRFIERLPNSVDREDLIGAGTVGLLEALKNFSPEHNTRLETYVDYRIKGAILDELRKYDFFSRSFRKKIQIVEEAKNRYYQSEKEYPSLEELKRLTGFEEKELIKILEVSENTLWISFEDLKNHILQKERSLETEPSSIVIKEEIIKKLSQFIEDLKENEKLVLSLYYEEELTMREVAEVLELSEGRVSQLHKQAIQKLRKKVKDLIES